jgi:hypothetical protein
VSTLLKLLLKIVLEFLAKAIRQEENTCNKVARYKINLQKSVAFLYINNEQIEKELGK